MGIFNKQDDGYQSPFDTDTNYVNPTQSNDNTASTESWTLPYSDQDSTARAGSTSGSGKSNSDNTNSTSSGSTNSSDDNTPGSLDNLDTSNIPGTFGSFSNPDNFSNLDILDKLDDAHSDRNHTHAASSDTQPQRPTSATTPSSQSSHSQYPQPTSHSKPANQHQPGNPNRPRSKHPHRLFTIIMLVIAALSINSILRSCTSIIGGAINNNDSSGHYSYSTPTPDNSETNAPADPQINVIAHEGELDTYQGSISVNIKNAQRGINTYENKPTVIITYQWTNNQNRNSYFDSVLNPSVYQHGQGLKDTRLYAYNDVDKQTLSRLKYDRTSSMHETAPGKSQTVTIAYELTDLNAPILVEANTYQSTTYVRSGFTLNGSSQESMLKRMDTEDADALADADNSKARGWQGDDNSEDSQSGEADKGATKDATSDADTKASEADGISNGDAMFQTWNRRGNILTVESITAKKVGRDYDGKESAIITIVWRNDSQIPFSLSFLGFPLFTQGNSEQSLQSAYYYPARSGFQQYSTSSSVRPGVTVTSQFAVELRDADMPVVVTMNGDSHAPKLQKELALS